MSAQMDIGYKIIAAKTVFEFEQLMREAIANGWGIEGNIVVTYEPSIPGHDFGMQYTQAMTRIMQPVA